MRTKVSNFLTKTISIVISLAMLLSTVFIFINSKKYYSVNDFNIPLVILFILMICAIVVGTLFVIRKNEGKISSKTQYIIMGVLITIAIIYQIIFVLHSFSAIGWDVSVVVGQAVTGSNPHYFIQYPNNLFLAFIFKAAYKITTIFYEIDIWKLTSIMNLIAVDFAILFTCLCSNKLFGKNGLFLTAIFSFLLIGFSPYLIVPYSDTFSMPSPPLLLLILLSYQETNDAKKKVLFSFLYGFCLFVGYLIKPTIAIVAIATIMIFLIQNVKFSMFKKPLIYLTVFSILLGVFTMRTLSNPFSKLVLGATTSEEDKERFEYPLTHFMMLGLYVDEEGRFGVYNGEDDIRTNGVLGKSEKVKMNVSMIKERAKKFGFFGMIAHLFNKYIWCTTDGTFFYGGEGGFIQMEEPDSALRGIFQNIIYWDKPFFINIVTNYQQALWIIVLFGIFCSLKTNMKEKHVVMFSILRLSLIGILMFLMLFENRSRYLLPFLPFFVLLSIKGYTEMYNLFFRKNKHVASVTN